MDHGERRLHTSVAAKLHHQRRIRYNHILVVILDTYKWVFRTWRCNPSSREAHDRKSLQPGNFLQEMERRLNVLRVRIQLFIIHRARPPNLAHDLALMAHGFDNIPRTGFSLGANERRTLGDPAQGLSEIFGAAHEGYLERVLVDVVLIVGGREHL
jgi:hypothetical protein